MGKGREGRGEEGGEGMGGREGRGKEEKRRGRKGKGTEGKGRCQGSWVVLGVSLARGRQQWCIWGGGLYTHSPSLNTPLTEKQSIVS